MDAIITPSPLFGSITAISSKSDVHRAIIAAALADKPTEIHYKNDCDDINATLNCVLALGANFKRSENGVTITQIKNYDNSKILDAGESGTTARLLIPIIAALGGATITGGGRLPERPFSELIHALQMRGSSPSAQSLPLTLSGKLEAGDFKIAGNISSQFISGLLFALPLLSGDSRIILTSPLESAGYVDMTLEVMRRFGVFGDRKDYGYFIKGGQKYLSPGIYEAEGDWSNAALWLCAGALGGDVTVMGLSSNSLQRDKAICDILEKYGANVTIFNNNSGVKVKASSFNGADVSVDASEIPDIIPVISAVASVAGTTTISGAARLRLKESDRLSTTAAMITALGGNAEITCDGLVIRGGAIKGGSVDSAGDHRIVMAAIAISSQSAGEIIIKNADVINKSYPTAFDDFVSLGGKVRFQ